MKFQYLFGPVRSRRLGISLGIDLVPHKVCNLNCLYCEIGQTTELTNTRKDYIPYEKVIIEVDQYIAQFPELDYITFSGAGEPTLNSGIGKIITYLKEKHPKYKIALITNSILLSDPKVRREILNVDLILPSLDAATGNTFRKINRPDENIDYNEVIQGLIDLRREYKGNIWLEYFIIEGINDHQEELIKMKEIIQLIKPDVLQLNSLDRPGTESWVRPVPKDKMEKIKVFFHPVNTRIISRYGNNKHDEKSSGGKVEEILNTIGRRPSTLEDLLTFTDISSQELVNYLNKLLSENKIEKQNRDDLIFYVKKN